MGYFLRALKAHPDVLEWIRERRWRHAERQLGETHLREEPVGYRLSKTVTSANSLATPPRSPGSRIAPSAKLLDAVSEILSVELTKPATEAEVAETLAVSKALAREWLNHLVRRGVLEKSSRPTRFQTARAADKLL